MRNPDHHIRLVFELPDGTLMRNYCHTIEGRTAPAHLTVYDADKEERGETFPFRQSDPCDVHTKFASIWTSDNGGKSWDEIHLFDKQPPFFLTAIHPLRDGSIVALGGMCVDWDDYSTWRGALTESKDAGKTWYLPDCANRRAK